MLEQPVDDIHVIVDALAEALDRDDKPTSLFGHSMGTLIAFELARRLESRSRPVSCLIASGMSAPQTLSAKPAPSDAEILSDLRSHGTTPPGLFEDPELLELVMPGLRADYTMTLGYRYRAGPRLTSRVFALAGTRDSSVTNACLVAWAEQTQAACETRMWEGGHMYLLDRTCELAGYAVACHLKSVDG